MVAEKQHNNNPKAGRPIPGITDEEKEKLIEKMRQRGITDEMRTESIRKLNEAVGYVPGVGYIKT